MAFEEFTGELDAPEKGVAYVPFSGQLDAPAKPAASGNLPTQTSDEYGNPLISTKPFKAKSGSVLEGLQIPEQRFDAEEADRLSNRAYAQSTPIPGTPRKPALTATRDRQPGASRATERGEALSDSSLPVRAAFKAVSGIAQGAGGVMRAAGDFTGIDALARAGAETSKGASQFEAGMGEQDAVEGFGPKSPVPYLGRMAEGAASSLGQSAAYAAGFGANAVIPLMSLMTAGQEYDQARTQGLTPAMALAGAVPKGIFEAVGEKFTGLDKVAGAMGTLLQKGASDNAKRTAGEILIRSGIREIPGEVITYLGQTGTDLLPGIGLKQDLTMSQFIDGLRDTVVQASMMGGSMAGGGHAAQSGTRPSKPIASADDLIRTHWGDAFVSQPKADLIGDITNAQTADEAIAAATRATQSSAAVDNIAQILAQNQRPGIANSALSATESIALDPDIAASTQAITELENANVSTDPAIQPLPAVPDGRGGNQTAPGVDAGVGTGAIAGPAVDAGSVLNSATGDSLPLGVTTQIDAVGANNVQNTPPASTAQTQTPPGQAPEAGAIEPARQPAAGVQAGNADVQAAGVAPVAQEARTDAEIDAKTDEVMAVVNEMGGGPSRELTRRMIVEKGFIVADKSIESLKAEVAKRENKLAKYEAAKEKLNQVRGSLIPDPRLTPVSQRTKPLKTEPNQPPAQQNQAPAAIENVAPDPAKNLADARTGLAELESKRKLTRSNKRADIDGQIARLKDTIYEMETAMDTTPAAEIRLGRDNQPIHRGGKPFKTSDAAKEAKALQPMMRVVRVEGGFALADKTPAQLAAEQASSRRLRNPKTSPAGEPIPAHAFIAAEGGLHADTRADMNLGDNPRIGNRTLFSGASRIGLSIEQATERLIEEGYLPEDANQNQAMALIKRSLSNPQYTPDGVERMAEKEAEQRRKDYDAEQEEIAKAQELEDNQLADLADAYEAAMLDYPQGVAQSDMDMADAMRAADFTEQEIENATTNRSQSETGTGQSPGGSDAPATGARMQGAGRREGAPGENSRSGSEDSQGLTAPTQQEVLDQQDRKGNADKLDDREQIRKESEAGANQFSLTQEEGRQDTTGGLFDAPVPAAPKPDSRPIKAGDVLLGKDGLEYTVVDVYGNTVDAERVVEQDRGNKIIKGISLTAIDAVDARDRLNKQKAQTPDPLAETKATLDAANVTGKERLDVLKDVKAGTLTPSEVKDAYPSKIGDKGMAMFSRPTNAPGPEQNALQALSQADVSDPQTGVSTALLYLGQDDSLYQLPRSSAKDMQAIAADKGVQFNIEAESVTQPDGTERPNGIFNLTMPSGAKASIIVNGGDVYINVSGLKEGDRGNAVYDVAANYAVNNDLVFKGDPSGLSDAAMRRRLENMLSSAIKYGTTDHLEPHPKQLQGDASIGVPALKWTPGDTLGNIRAMVDASIEANDYSNPFGATLEYDPSSQRFKDPASGRNLGDQEVEAFSRLDDRNAGAGTAGRTTLQRTALFKSLVQSEGARRAFLESIRRQRSQRGTGVGAAGSALAGAFYSRSADPVAAAQSTQAVEKIVQGITSRWTNTPEVIVVSDMQDPRIPEKVRAQDLEQRSGGATGEPEGFYLGGKVYIVASQVSNPKDVARVLFHESLGHFGLRGVFGDELKPILRQLSVLRRADVAAKAKQYGLDMGIESQRLQAAEEVLAELAQTRPELGFVKSAIAIIRSWLRDNVPGFEKMALTDADIIAQFIIPARGFVERGAKAQMRGAVPAFSRGTNDAVTNPKDVVGNQGGRSADDTSLGDLLRKLDGTQVVDANGEPLLVYHGSKTKINSFDGSKTVDGGLHFGSKSQASMRSSKNLHPAYLYAENLRRSKDTGGNWKGKIASAKAAGYDGIVYLNRYEGVSKETVFRLQSQGSLGKLDGMSDAEFRRAVPEAQDSYIVFDAKQVIKPNEPTAPDSGGAPMFSRGTGNATGSSLDVRDVDKFISSVNVKLPADGARVSLARTFEDLPNNVQQAAQEAGVTPASFRGVTMGKGNVYVVQNAHSSLAELQATVLHELYGHVGLRSLFGPEITRRMNKLYLALGESKFTALAEKYGLNLEVYQDIAQTQADQASQKAVIRANGRPELRNAILAEELLAHMAQSETGSLRQQAREIIGSIRNWLRENGFSELADINEFDLAHILKMGRQAMETNKPFLDMPMFATGGPIPTSAQQAMPTARQPLPANQALSPWRDGTGRMQFAPGQWLYNQLGRAAGPALVRLGLKAATPELRRQLRQMKIDVEKAQEVAGAIAKETMILSEDERAMVSDLVEKELKAGVIPPAHAVRLAAMINDAMNQQTDELVNLGMLTKDSADRWRGQYLPRYYESKMREKGQDAWADALKRLTGRTSVMKGIKGKHLKGRGLYETIHEAELANYEALGWEVRDPDYNPSLPSVDGTVQVWRDFTRQERDGMGEIRDAGFRFVMGYMQTQRDIAVGRMFERMAQDPEQSSRLEKEGYVQVPTTTVSGTGAKVYGKLAGRWVPAETLSQLSNIEEGQSAAWQMYRKAMGIWKEGKTALNPVSHVNNMVSNLTMAHLAGVSYHRGDKYLSAARDFFKKSGMIQEAKDNGLFLGTMSDTELMNVLPDDLKLLVQKQESTTEKVARTGFEILTMFLRKPMGAAYQAEDTFFRYLIYKDAREQGMEPQDSVEYAQKFIFTYDDLPKGARRIRDFGVPFFSYTYKAVPALLHTALTHPVRMAGPAAVLWGINAAAYAIAAGDDDDSWMQTLQKYLKDENFREAAKKKEQLEREHLPSWMKGTTALLTPKTLRLGMDEVTKLPLFIDISRIIPGGDLFDVSPNAGGLPIPQPITPSHPLFTTAVAMLGNKDLFYGKELTDSNDTIGEASTKRAAWLWKQLTPAIAAGNYHWERGMNALAQANGGEIKYVPDMLGGDATGIGRDGLPVQPKYAAMQTFGVKVRPMDLDSAEAIDQSMKNKMIKDIDIELKKLQRLNNKGAIPDRVMENARELSQVKKERLRLGLTVDGGEKP